MRQIRIFTIFLFFDHCNNKQDKKIFDLNKNVSSQVYSWFTSQQLTNGLVESVANGICSQKKDLTRSRLVDIKTFHQVKCFGQINRLVESIS